MGKFYLKKYNYYELYPSNTIESNKKTKINLINKDNEYGYFNTNLPWFVKVIVSDDVFENNSTKIFFNLQYLRIALPLELPSSCIRALANPVLHDGEVPDTSPIDAKCHLPNE